MKEDTDTYSKELNIIKLYQLMYLLNTAFKQQRYIDSPYAAGYGVIIAAVISAVASVAGTVIAQSMSQVDAPEPPKLVEEEEEVPEVPVIEPEESEAEIAPETAIDSEAEAQRDRKRKIAASGSEEVSQLASTVSEENLQKKTLLGE